MTFLLGDTTQPLGISPQVLDPGLLLGFPIWISFDLEIDHWSISRSTGIKSGPIGDNSANDKGCRPCQGGVTGPPVTLLPFWLEARVECHK